MKKPSNKDIWMVDDIVCDILVYEIQEDRAPVQGQTGGGLGRPHISWVNPHSGLIETCWLSYEGMKSED
jgi:hypothetical protein